VTVEDSAGARCSIYRTVNSGGSFGTSPLQQHVGLGRNARRLDVEIWWPASNTRQRFAVRKNQIIDVREMAEGYATLTRAPLPLGGRRAGSN
jgi:hypothetical protein